MNVSFPAVTKGGLLGLTVAQWAGCGLALAVFTVGMFTLRSMPLLFLDVIMSAGVATVGLWPVNGLTPAEWAARAGQTNVRRAAGRHAWMSPMPLADHPPALFRNVTILETTVNGHPVGVLTDGAGPKLTYTAALAVEGTSFGLASQDDRDRKVSQWGTLVAALGESLASRVQVIGRAVPADPEALRTYHADHLVVGADPAWDAGYRALLDDVPTANVTTELAVAVTVDFRRRGVAGEVRRLGGGETGRLALVGAETERLAEQLTGAGIHVVAPLDPMALCRRVRTTFDPFAEEADSMWPSALVDRWATAQCDGAVHASFWVAGWPQRPVEAGGFLAPLLLRSSKVGHVRTFTITIEPAGQDGAQSRVEQARFMQEMEVRYRLEHRGSLTVRQQKKLDRLKERETELDEGHTDTRYVGVVTVSAPNAAWLADGVADVQRAALRSHLRLRRQYGYQAGMLGMALPLGRGFERKTVIV